MGFILMCEVNKSTVLLKYLNGLGDAQQNIIGVLGCC